MNIIFLNAIICKVLEIMTLFTFKSIGNHKYAVHAQNYTTKELMDYLNEVCQWCKINFGNDYMNWNLANVTISFDPNDCIEKPNPNNELLFKLTWLSND
jgi:hypothetical protein